VRDQESYELDQLLKGIEDLQLQMVTLKNQIEALTINLISTSSCSPLTRRSQSTKEKSKRIRKGSKKIIASYAPQEFLLLKSILDWR